VLNIKVEATWIARQNDFIKIAMSSVGCFTKKSSCESKYVKLVTTWFVPCLIVSITTLKLPWGSFSCIPVRYETVRFLYHRVGPGTGIIRQDEIKESVTGCPDSVNVTLGWSRPGETGERDGITGACIARFVEILIVS